MAKSKKAIFVTTSNFLISSVNEFFKSEFDKDAAPGVKSTKNSEWRNAHISQDLKEVLLKIKKEHPHNENVLPQLAGWRDGNAGKILRAFLLRIGTDRHITFHTLRACFATHVLASGAEPTQVMKMGGWSDFKTFQIYIRMAGVDVKGVTDDFNVTPKLGALDNVIRLKR